METPLYGFWRVRNALHGAFAEYAAACRYGDEERIALARVAVAAAMDAYERACAAMPETARSGR